VTKKTATFPHSDQNKTVKSWIKKQRICVTGGRGTLAKYLIGRLIAYGAGHIVVFDNRPPVPNGEQTLNLTHVTGDILSIEDLNKSVADCSTVFHLAAQGDAGEANAKPLECFKINVQGTVNVLESCRLHGVRQVVYVSTTHVYGHPRCQPIREDHPVAPLSIYAASKLAGEIIVQGYAASFGLNCAIARLSNIYGGYFGVNTVIGSALEQASEEKTISLHDLSCIRNFVYAGDVAEALIRLAYVVNKRRSCLTCNVSTDYGVSVSDMAKDLIRVAATMGLHVPGIEEIGKQSNSIPTIVIDPGYFESVTGWRLGSKLEKGLALALHELLEKKKELSGKK
jgi:UDP-glucose 4-epimerase